MKIGIIIIRNLNATILCSGTRLPGKYLKKYLIETKVVPVYAKCDIAYILRILIIMDNNASNF